jgi:hypothetical protein
MRKDLITEGAALIRAACKTQFSITLKEVGHAG